MKRSVRIALGLLVAALAVGWLQLHRHVSALELEARGSGLGARGSK